ncbi:unnamed protein product [Dracunculus medinensis]|uniref:ApeC domain-containing protein n=1 Tax=Dracunculus medinensis TaxID=318479 RepID=A0A0N4UKP8_DRAME|nr:unnamed protein product [Dracunculus medinensis]
MVQYAKYAICSIFFLHTIFIDGDYCGENRIPFGFDVHISGQPYLLCSRPNCFEKKYSDCEDSALRTSCDEDNTWIGGINKNYGLHQPFYVLCCTFDEITNHSTPPFTMIIRPGEYFEGEEQMDSTNDDVIAFDVITNLKRFRDTPKTYNFNNIFAI